MANAAGIKIKTIKISPQLIIDNAEKVVLLTDVELYIGINFSYPVNKEIREYVDVIFGWYFLGPIIVGRWLFQYGKIINNDIDLLNSILKRRSILIIKNSKNFC